MSKPPDHPSTTEEESALLSWVEEFSPYGVLTTDRELRIRSWNRWMEIASGLKVEDVLGKPLVALFPNLAEPRFAGPLQRALQGEVSLFSTALHDFFIPLLPQFRNSGFDQMQQTARLAPLLLQKEILGTIIIIEDVTQREFQSSIVRRQHNREKILSWSLAHLLKARETRRSVRELFYKIAENFDFDAYFLYLIEPGGALKLHAVGGITPEEEAPLQERLENSATSWVALNPSGSASVFERATNTIPADTPPDKLGIQAYLVLPLVIEDCPIGAFCVATRTRPTIPKEEEELLTTIAQYLAVALNREITGGQLHEAQAKLSEHAQLLEKQVSDRTAKLTETISELQTFSYSLAHDLRAPIRSMNGYCEILLNDFSDLLPEAPKDVLQRLARACDRLDAFTRDLLEFTRVSRQEIKLTNLDTEKCVAEALNLGSPGLREAVSVRSPLLNIQANHGLVLRCLSNLLENALKFASPETPPRIEVWTESVEGDSASESRGPLPFNSPILPGHKDAGPSPRGQVRLWIEDNGIGIPGEAHAKIFGIFERAAGATMFTRTGIGLAIVARAMQRMGGKCGVQSQVGAGSRFWLEFAASTPNNVEEPRVEKRIPENLHA